MSPHGAVYTGVKHLNTQSHALFSIYTHAMTLSAKCFSGNRSVILLLVYFRLRGETEEVKHSSDILMSKTLQALYRCFPVLLSFNVCLSLSLFGSPFSRFFLFFVVVYYINTFLLLTIYLHGNRNCLLIFVSLCLFNSLCGVCCRQGHCSALNIIAVPYRCNLISTVICLSLHHPACRICPDKSHHFL